MKSKILPLFKPASACKRSLALAILLPASVMAQTESDEPFYWEAKNQITYNWQKHGSFGAAYSGPNSMTSGADKMYTFSITSHLGMRLWKGGEAYFNPEAASGVPFSTNLVGLGGFTNGEITRAAGTTPKLYRQRLFLRQTWNNGGGAEKVESDFNQLPGTVDKNRFVLTMGNFSTLDVFDDNAYAKDPRTQFMNWGNWTYSAWDYAADARGFGWGFAGEWYVGGNEADGSGDWVLRFGRMTGPKVPNGLPVDFAIGKHYGDQVELERSHHLGGQPGKVRVLGWRNRAVLASFDDATAYLQAHPGGDPQAFFNVRNGEKIKYGLGLNLEQAINDNAGFFFRGMKTDGRTETYAFTEVDNSLSTGVLVKGKSWGRANDAFGLSLAQNTLSADRRRFLAAGGVSFFIGDGALSYKPETIVEAFYNVRVTKNTWVTADFQRIANPAYNAARGPVNVLAVRLHAEF